MNMIAPRKPSGRLMPTTLEQIKRLLRAGKTILDVAEITRVSKSHIGRIKAEMEGEPRPSQAKPKPNGTAIQPSRKTDFREVFRAAEALRLQRLAERRAELSANKWVNQVTEVEA